MRAYANNLGYTLLNRSISDMCLINVLPMGSLCTHIQGIYQEFLTILCKNIALLQIIITIRLTATNIRIIMIKKLTVTNSYLEHNCKHLKSES